MNASDSHERIETWDERIYLNFGVDLLWSQYP